MANNKKVMQARDMQRMSVGQSISRIFGKTGTYAFLILMAEPGKTLFFIIMFLILQQLEGQLIYPHVVGNAVGLPSIWVLVAVSVGGSLFGVMGMLLGVPVFAVI